MKHNSHYLGIDPALICSHLMTPGFLARSDSIFLTQEPHVIPAMESVHERTGSVAIPVAVRGAIAGSLEESKNSI